VNVKGEVSSGRQRMHGHFLEVPAVAPWRILPLSNEQWFLYRFVLPKALVSKNSVLLVFAVSKDILYFPFDAVDLL
jgi:hypothetical protein